MSMKFDNSPQIEQNTEFSFVLFAVMRYNVRIQETRCVSKRRCESTTLKRGNHMEKMYDIVIVGLGPAGSTLARLLDKNFKVAVIDRKGGQSGFQKPCGGLLAPDAQKAFAGLGLTLPKEILVDPQIFAVKTLDLARKLERHYQRFYLNLDRHKLDLWLMSLIPPSVDIIAPAVCVSVKPSGAGFEICYKSEGEQKVIYAKYVVGADGASGVVRRNVYPDSRMRRYAALQQRFAAPDMKPLYSCIFDPEITDCYAWALSKDGSFILGGAFPLNGAKERLDILKQKLMDKGYDIGNPVKTEGCIVLCPRLSDVRTGKGGAFLVGEAAGFISPSSLEGVSWALTSARILAETLNARPASPNSTYFRKTLKMRFKLFIKNIKGFFIYNPFLRYIIMKSGLQKINVYSKEVLK